MMCWKCRPIQTLKLLLTQGRNSQPLFRCQSMRKSGKCGAKTAQEAAWCDLRSEVAFSRENIGVTKVGVEILSPFRLLWTFTTAFPFSFYWLPAESPANLPEDNHKMWARWVLLLWSGFQRPFWHAWCCSRALELCPCQSWVLCQTLLTSDSEEIAQLMQHPPNVTFSVCCKCLSPKQMSSATEAD